MAATFRQIVNNVLVNVGQGQAQIPSSNTAITDTYQLQVANFVQHFMDEVQQAAQWAALTQNINMIFPGGNFTFTSPLSQGALGGTLSAPYNGLSGTWNIWFNDNEWRAAVLTNGSTTVTWTPALGPQAVLTPVVSFYYAAFQRIIDLGTGAYMTSDSRLRRMYKPEFGREVALVFDTTSFPLPFVLGEIPYSDEVYYNNVLANTPIAYSTNYSIQDTGSDVVNICMYPTANTNRNIQIWAVIPQPRIDPTVAGSATYPWLGTMGLDTPVLIPNRIIELGASWYTLEERGEELGQSGMFTEDRYRNQLADMVSNETARSGEFQMIIS